MGFRTSASSTPHVYLPYISYLSSTSTDIRNTNEASSIPNLVCSDQACIHSIWVLIGRVQNIFQNDF